LVRFTVDPDDAIAETYEINNSLQDRTNALSAQVAIHPTAYAACNIPLTTSLPFSAEDWIQKHIARWNQALAESTYPTTPPEVTDRVRLDSIVISSVAPPVDRSYDIQWFLGGDDCRPPGQNPQEDIDWGFIHEMCHKAGLIDLYQFDLEPTNVYVTDGAGNPVNMGHQWPNGDFMGGGNTWPHNDARFLSSHSAGGSASNKGYRRGYYGEYQFDIPEQNIIQVLDNQGHPAPGVEVALYQRGVEPPYWTDVQGIDATPEISGTSDASGMFLLANRDAHGGVTTATGHTLHDNPFGAVDIVGTQNTFLLRLRLGEHEEFRWLDITELNLAYWIGDTISHTYMISSHVPPPHAPQAPVLSGVQAQGDWARVCWQDSPSPGVTGYRLYRATRLTSGYELVLEGESGPCLEDSYGVGSYGGKTYAVTAVNAQGLESGFSNFGWAPTLSNPASIQAGSI
jgi:hypothetical protein